MESLLTGTELARQIEIEKRATAEGRRRFFAKLDEDAKKGRHSNNVPAQRWLANWAKGMILNIRMTRKKMKTERYGGGGPGIRSAMPIFALVSPPKIAAIAMCEMLNLCLANPDGVNTTKVFMAIGRAVVAQAQMDKWRKEQKWETVNGRRQKVDGPLQKFGRIRRKPSPLDVNMLAKKIDENSIYDRKLCCSIGGMLAFAVQCNCSRNGPGDPFELAFHYELRRGGNKTRGKLSLDKRVRNAIAYDTVSLASIRPSYPPMVVPPYEHADVMRGGYIEIPSRLLAKSTKEQRSIISERLPKLKHVTDAIQVQGASPIRTNGFALHVVDQLKEMGGGVANLPFSTDFARPPKPSDPKDLDIWKRDCSRIHRKNKVNRSKFRGMVDVTDTARTFGKEPRLYMPGRICVRGRWYPIPLYFHHHGGDLERSLIEMADPRSGEGDLYQVAIQCANMFGIDRVSYAERVEWVKSHMRNIYSAVKNPLGDDWWTRADNPLQFLAACRAMVNKEAASRLPIQRDCTSSGFQHYAAMARDEIAAPMVNLTASDEPFALYREVANRVAEDIPGKGGAELIARLIDTLPKEDGWLVKPNTMTKVYKVTTFGARKQVRLRLQKLGWTRDDARAGAKIVAEATLRITGEMFPRVTAVMNWLVDCATKIAKANRLVMWEAPSGLPVVQGYRKMRLSQITTQFHRVNLWMDDETMPVSVGGQVNGIAANFVHSVDASHLQMVALECKRRGIPFLGVHDCHWSHACHAEEVAAIAREKFAELHAESHIDRIWNYWAEQHPDIDFLPPPEPGSYDPSEVLGSQYFTC